MSASNFTDDSDFVTCVAKYGLMNAKPSETWTAYLAQREAAANRSASEQLLAGSDDGCHSEMVDFAVDNLLDSLKLEDQKEKVLQDGIYILSQDVIVGGDMTVRSAEVLSRIYSPNNPSAVDVYLSYYDRTRDSSVEFHCDIYYLMHDTFTGMEFIVREPEGPGKMHGFQPLLHIDLLPQKHEFNITKSQTQALFMVLFANESIRRCMIPPDAMMRLMLASVGIAMSMGRGPENDSFESDEIRWDGLEDNAHWLGKNVRRVSW
ncbi:hypothetical protein MVEN_01391100 [Mycena venus]|uniref:Uncharacterized protein n=1 Tax=Mycena venus TaxID=2733690 RepID=A0A8H6XX15_9AGAR|nr:hypothetical protein MVEN_01391100 [Mycena venus]